MMKKIQTAAVVGAGQMGTGIAQALALAGYQVLVHDSAAGAWERCRAQLQAGLDRLTEKGKLSGQQRDGALASLRFAADLSDLAEADLVIEAVPEDLALKQSIFRTLGQVCRPEALLCTNTSSIPIRAVTAQCAGPERCAGMHFFFPVHATRLVEVVRAEQTSSETVAAVKEAARTMGKVAVECRTDTPGFIVNRCLFAFLLEAVREYEEGVASFEDIDQAIKLGLNHPMGPFELMDLSGLDTFPHVTETLEALSPTPWTCPPSVLARIDAGKLGRKSSEGWYVYGKPEQKSKP